MAATQEFIIGVDDDGRLTFIDHPELAFLKELGQTETNRASHVEPDAWLLRVVFHYLRRHFGDDSKVGESTRSWGCLWRVNLGPVNGPILDERWIDRSQAIAAEVRWLNANHI